PASPAPASGGRILVLDDEPLVAEALATQLRSAGFAVQATDDPRATLERLVAGERFDLVFCDLMMAGVTGVELAAALEARAPERLAQVVFMTGGAFTTAAAAFVAARAEACVEKPFDVVGETRRRLRPRG